MLTVEFAADLDCGLRLEEATTPNLWPVTDVFQLKIPLTKYSLFCACKSVSHFLQCFVLFGLGIISTSGFYKRKKKITMVETHVFDRICRFSPNLHCESYWSFPRMCRSTAFSWVRCVTACFEIKFVCILRTRFISMYSRVSYDSQHKHRYYLNPF